MGALYASSIFLGLNNASSVQHYDFGNRYNASSIERTVFYREKAAGMYSPIPYAIAQGLVVIPYIILQTILYAVITYFMINFERTARTFFLYCTFMFLTFTYFTFYGMMAVGLTPSQHLAAVISSAFYSLWNLLSGFLIPRPLSDQEDLIVWMRTAALPSFRKLYGRIEEDLDEDDVVVVNLLNNYNTYSFGGKKKIVLSTSSWLGGRNNFPGMTYILVGASSVFIALIFLLLHVKSSRLTLSSVYCLPSFHSTIAKACIKINR